MYNELERKTNDVQGNVYYCKYDALVGSIQEISSLITELSDDIYELSKDDVAIRLNDIVETIKMAEGEKLIIE